MKDALAWFLLLGVTVFASATKTEDTPSKDKSSMMATVWSWMTDNPVVRAAKSLMSKVIGIFKSNKEKTEVHEETKPLTHWHPPSDGKYTESVEFMEPNNEKTKTTDHHNSFKKADEEEDATKHDTQDLSPNEEKYTDSGDSKKPDNEEKANEHNHHQDSLKKTEHEEAETLGTHGQSPNEHSEAVEPEGLSHEKDETSDHVGFTTGVDTNEDNVNEQSQDPVSESADSDQDIDHQSSNDEPEVSVSENVEAEIECGTIDTSSTSTRLAGAEGAQRHSRPWFIYLVETSFDGRDSGYFLQRKCGASLIPVKDNKKESDIIVTSATCVAEGLRHTKTLNTMYDAYSVHYNNEKIKFQAYAGLHSKQDNVQGNPIEFAEIFYHKDYALRNGIYLNDISAIKLARPLPFGKAIRPICLPSKTETPIGKDCVLTGLGHGREATDELQNLPVTAMSAEQCRTNQAGRYEWYRAYRDRTMVCAKKNNEAAKTELEDLGDPMACIDKASKIWNLFGIMTFGNHEGSVAPVLSTRVPNFHDWIVKLANGVTSVV